MAMQARSGKADVQESERLEDKVKRLEMVAFANRMEIERLQNALDVVLASFECAVTARASLIGSST